MIVIILYKYCNSGVTWSQLKEYLKKETEVSGFLSELWYNAKQLAGIYILI